MAQQQSTNSPSVMRRPATKATIYSFQEFPKYVPGPDGPVIVDTAEEERRIRLALARYVGRVRVNAIKAARADAFAAEMVRVIVAIRAEGVASFRGIASPRGGRWQASQVQRLLHRAERTAAALQLVC
jgi:hypothetical protein